MKLLAVTLASLTKASHYRGGSYSVRKGDSGDFTIDRSQTWRRSFSGYAGGCTNYHVLNKIPAQEYSEYCSTLNSGNTCGSTTGGYIVTDIEDQLAQSDNFCYGSRDESFPNPGTGFEIKWDDCCWVQFTDDDNNQVSGGSFGFIAQVKDTDNNSPQTRLPPIWKIMAGCPDQTLVLNPTDIDGDTVKCRFATSEESLGAWKGNHNFASISIDEDTCILTYDGTLDTAQNGVKPIAIQVEDFDRNGNVKSSMPLQFLATVWTPTNTNFRLSGRFGPGNPFVYENLFPEGDDDHDDGRKRRSVANIRSKRSVPDYCYQKPLLTEPTPVAGSTFEVGASGITFTLSATSENGAITRFSYQSPSGMSCSPVNANGEVTCNFTPSSDQYATNQGFCFNADDAAGLQTERRCISFNVLAPQAVLMDIHSMLDALDARGRRYANYGCNGAGQMDHNAPNAGKPVDVIDKALQMRKACLRCAQTELSKNYEKYEFNTNSQTCLDAIGTAKRSFCECDKFFVVTDVLGYIKPRDLYNPNQMNLDLSSCQKINNGGADNKCCRNSSFIYQRYDATRQECCRGTGVRNIGEC